MIYLQFVLGICSTVFGIIWVDKTFDAVGEGGEAGSAGWTPPHISKWKKIQNKIFLNSGRLFLLSATGLIFTGIISALGT